MLSYAQNHEDVVLARALRDVERGFYIDAGAGSPVADSVTKHFYDAGWHGINIEPLHRRYDELCAARQRDVNLNVALGAHAGDAVFYDVGDRWGNSTLSPELAARYAAEGDALTEYRVQVMTLNQVCEAHVTGPIDFLKIDVEGNERDVLSAFDMSRWRPRIIVIEATVPGQGDPCHQLWEDLLLGAEYIEAYFDGVNRYYVAREAAALIPALAVPPNWFDHFVPYQEHLRIQHVEELAAHIHTQLDELQKHQRHLAEVQEYVTHLLAHIETLETQVRERDELRIELERYVAHVEAELRAKEGHIAELERALVRR